MQGNEDKKKFHLVKWEEVRRNKKEGKLGIRYMKKQNKSLTLALEVYGRREYAMERGDQGNI